MSEKNVKAARQMIDAWNRGDFDEWATRLDDEVVWHPIAENPQTEPVHGAGSVRDFVSDWVEPWDEYKVEITDVFDRAEWVVVAGHHEARHAGGAEIRMDMWVAAAFRDGKGVEFRWFTNEADALAVAGIESPARE